MGALSVMMGRVSFQRAEAEAVAILCRNMNREDFGRAATVLCKENTKNDKAPAAMSAGPGESRSGSLGSEGGVAEQPRA